MEYSFPTPPRFKGRVLEDYFIASECRLINVACFNTTTNIRGVIIGQREWSALPRYFFRRHADRAAMGCIDQNLGDSKMRLRTPRGFGQCFTVSLDLIQPLILSHYHHCRWLVPLLRKEYSRSSFDVRNNLVFCSAHQCHCRGAIVLNCVCHPTD